MALRTIGVKLMAEVSNYVSNVGKATTSTRAFIAELDKAAKAGKLDAVASQAQRMGLAFAGAFAAVEFVTARFDQQMSKVKAVTDESASGMQRLRQVALQAGKDTVFSATEAAQAEEELGKAGLSASDILGGALTGALALAAAGSLSLAEAADVSAKTMNVFGLKSSDVGHIADVLAAAANKSATDVHEMAEALRMGGLAANAAGMSLEETAGTLAAFAQSTLVGSDAGTSLKTMLMRLQAPTAEAAAEMKRLGIEVYDAKGNFIGTTKLAGVLQTQLSGLTQEQRNAALATIFGADAMRSANALYVLGEKGVRDYVNAVNDQGAAQRAANTMTDNLIGDIERLKGALETLAIESGSASTGPLRVLADVLTRLVDGFASLPPWLSQSTVLIFGLAGAGLLGFSAFIKLRSSAADALEELRKMGPTGEKVADGLGKAGTKAKMAAAAFAALVVATALINTFSKDLNIQFDALGKGLEDWAHTGRLTGEAARVLGNDMKDLDVGLQFLADTSNNRKQFVRWAQDLIESLPLLGSVVADTNTSLTKTRERVQAIDAELAAMVRSGRGEAAVEVFKALANHEKKFGVSTQELMALMPEYAGAMEKLGGATNAAAAAHALAARNSVILQGGLAGLVRETGSLTNAWKSLHGTMVAWADAEINFEEAIDQLSESVKRNGNALDFDSAAGRENNRNIIAAVKAANAAAQAKYDNTVATQGEAAALGAANDVYNQHITKLREQLTALGFTEQQVQDLISLFASMPPIIATPITTPGLDTAIAKTLRLLQLRQQLGSNVAASNAYGDSGYTSGRRWGGITEHAQSGLLREAAYYSPRSPARYAFAEPATGGEMFVPKYGNPARSVGMLNRAAGWYGHTVVPTNMSIVGSSMPTRATSGSAISPNQIAAAIAAALHGVAVVMDGRQVGRIQASQANLLRRGGG